MPNSYRSIKKWKKKENKTKPQCWTKIIISLALYVFLVSIDQYELKKNGWNFFILINQKFWILTFENENNSVVDVPLDMNGDAN